MKLLLLLVFALLSEIVSPLQRPFSSRGGGTVDSSFSKRAAKPSRFVSSALFSSSTTTTNSDNNDDLKQPVQSLYKNKQVVVVGGGPVGLATALTLSNAPHNYDVTVLEQSPEASAYDPTKAYLYLVNPRGQTWTQQFPRVQQLLTERGSLNRGMGNLIIVPADPEVDVPELASRSTLAPPPKDPVADSSYWIPRHAMVKLLEQVVHEQQEEKAKIGDAASGSIQYLPHIKCASLQALDNGQVEIHGEDVTGDNADDMTFVADLVVAADGANSAVRDHLNTAATKKQGGGGDDWLSNHKKDFQIKVWNSAASLLRMKVLQFPPGFRIPPVTTPTSSEQTYAIRCKYTGPRNYVSLGLLPVKDPDSIRPTNVITRPDHDIWKITNGPEMKAWFHSAFPRFGLSSSDDEGGDVAFEGMIDDTEWDRFANALGTTFPKCQYCPALQVSSGEGTGVVLVGDACHAFPPDIGQGINAGLADVVALDRALQGKDLITGENPSSKTKPQLEDALETYEKIRVPEIKSLIRLARFGSPYQYRQPHYRDKVGRNLWFINVAVKTMLNKISGGFIPGAAIIGAFDKKYTYRQLMRRSDTTSVLLWTILAAVCQKFVGTTGTIIGAGVATALWFFTYWFGK